MVEKAYVAVDVWVALNELEYQGKVFYGVGRKGISQETIRRYAKNNGLAIQKETRHGEKIWSIPEGNLEALIKGLKIQVKMPDFYAALR